MPDLVYLYTSKEYQNYIIDGTSEEFFDFGVRMYDPVVGRWGVPDPAGQFVDFAPYGYYLNSPLVFSDPDGREVIIITESDEIEKLWNYLTSENNLEDYEFGSENFIISDYDFLLASGGPVDIKKSTDPISDILNRVVYLTITSGDISNLNEVILDNDYFNINSMGRNYLRYLDHGGLTFKLRISPFTTKQSESYWEVWDYSFGHLNRRDIKFGNKSGGWGYDGGYGYGFYMFGMQVNRLITIGASNIESYFYLRNLIYKN